MKIISKLIIIISLLITTSCEGGFDSKKANELLEKTELTTDDYSEMIRMYENGIDDAIKFSKEPSKKLSSAQQEEMMLIFAIGMRLSKDDVHLTDQQRKEFQRINLKGTEEYDDPQ